MRWMVLAGWLVGCDVAPVESTPPPSEAPALVFGRCLYVNSFSDAAECKEYTGAAWDDASATEDCNAPLPGADPGVLETGVGCDRSSILGECFIAADTPDASTLVFPGEYGDSCDGLELGCAFASGTYVPSELCGGEPPGGVVTGVFTPFEQVCVEPLAGEPEGQTEGQVCTWEAISGVTEEGRYFPDYADCDVVVTQRPYWASTIEADTAPDDPRLSDGAWLAEYDWVTEQVEAAACVCCHSNVEAPNGEPSGWYVEAAPIWTDTLDPDGMAMMAGWVDSSVFGAFPAEENNGFSRAVTGMPTTDDARMESYFAGELARRGYDQADFVETTPFGGPLYDQLVYEAGGCDAGEGVDAEGRMEWSGGGARYVYVLESDSSPPGVPPNLDLPEGTLWRLDVDASADPVASGMMYGEVPSGATQRVPASGAAPALVSGETYYLYVLADVYQPLTRCLFTAP